MKLKGHRFVDSDEVIENATKQLKDSQKIDSRSVLNSYTNAGRSAWMQEESTLNDNKLAAAPPGRSPAILSPRPLSRRACLSQMKLPKQDIQYSEKSHWSSGSDPLQLASVSSYSSPKAAEAFKPP
ncbi:hypothetical protein AVEN_70488-1 [Araneus ventricosus]|uniref:Uncharacterized protein n=1 Tax=Araneus ventricosus TaxID=182803 RepID=A0A4Y2H3J0_ARAVE|nr:hypothetical protein AVEN_70488-1 [Araneus ventricosus]